MPLKCKNVRLQLNLGCVPGDRKLYKHATRDGKTVSHNFASKKSSKVLKVVKSTPTQTDIVELQEWINNKFTYERFNLKMSGNLPESYNRNPTETFTMQNILLSIREISKSFSRYCLIDTVFSVYDSFSKLFLSK